jgi:hypothetical protein
MTIRQRWRQTALHNKLYVIIAALGLFATVTYYTTTLAIDEVHRREDRRPEVVNYKPPEFLQPFICYGNDGNLHAGKMQQFAKNIGIPIKLAQVR